MSQARVLVAPDKLKGSLSSEEAARALGRGLASTGALVSLLSLADGGEGTLDVLANAARAKGATVEVVSVQVAGPLGARVSSCFAFLQEERRAILESARAIGLALVPASERDPLRASSRGLGELALAAIERGAREVWIGLGGTATTDGGTGFARAFGARFQDDRGEELAEGGGSLERIAKCDLSRVDLRGARLVALADVRNPLLGARGAARTYGPQKGASPDAVAQLERGLAKLAYLVDPALSRRVGSGAAGGLGFGLAAFARAELAEGAARVASALELDASLSGKDLVVTGEGALDRTTFEGKVVHHVLARARALGVRAAVVAGKTDAGTRQRTLDLGVASVLTLEDLAQGSHERAVSEAASLLERAGAELGRSLST
ncbi:glycerate kinase [bacterium]|nr:glycerate kinase [bacterium]